MAKSLDGIAQRQARRDSSQPGGKALQVNENSKGDAGPPQVSPPVPRKSREQRQEKQRGKAIRVNENTA